MNHRYFKAPKEVLNEIRVVVMSKLAQPNGRASEPWPVDGTAHDGVHGYVALGAHHTTGEFAPLVAHFLEMEGVEEIAEAEYRAAWPAGEVG